MQYGRKTIVIYPGRFQPMLPHHVEVLKQLQAKYGDEVYVATTDKVDPNKNNFFDFEEKKQIASQMYGINSDHILKVSNPYNGGEYAEKHFADQADQAVLLFAVGEKDMQDDPRFPKQPNATKKNGELAYLQLPDGFEKGITAMNQHAFLIVAPTVKINGETASASAFRSAFAGAQDDQHAKEVFEKFFGSFNESIFQLVNEKIRGPQTMDKQLNEMRKLAGLSLNESAPVDFGGEEPQGDGTNMAREYDYEEIANMAKDAVFLPPSASSTKSSIANRINGDLSDPAVRGDAIMSALKSGAGASVLGEINERLDPKHGNQITLSSYLGEIVDQLNDGGRLGNLPADQQSVVAKIAVAAAHRMELEQGADDEEEFNEDDDIDQVSLNDDQNLNEAGALRSIQLFDTLAEMIGRAIKDTSVTDEIAEYLEAQDLVIGSDQHKKLSRNHAGFALFLDTLVEVADIRVYSTELNDEEVNEMNDGVNEARFEGAEKTRAYGKGKEAGKESTTPTVPEKFADGGELEAEWKRGFADAQKSKTNEEADMLRRLAGL